MLKPNASKVKAQLELAELVREFKQRGGVPTVCDPAIAKGVRTTVKLPRKRKK